jgi:hypothetical protein
MGIAVPVRRNPAPDEVSALVAVVRPIVIGLLCCLATERKARKGSWPPPQAARRPSAAARCPVRLCVANRSLSPTSSASRPARLRALTIDRRRKKSG